MVNPGNRLPGTHRSNTTSLDCRRCRLPVVPHEVCGGICRDEHSRFLNVRCVNCGGLAYSYTRPFWECDCGGSFKGPLCPTCWSPGIQGGNVHVCIGPEKHPFESHTSPCRHCGFGLLVRLIGSAAGICEACGQTELWS